MADTRRMAREERADFADLLETLTPAQWDASSLCERWRVRDVVAHVVGYEGIGLGEVALRVARAGFLPDRANQNRVDELADQDPSELVALMRRFADPTGLTAVMGGRIALTDGLIHQQDVRRPLGLSRQIPVERVRAALDVAVTAPTLPARRLGKGLRLVAADLDWSHGAGDEVRGPGEAVLMAVAGRPAALDDLTGPGVATLVSRLGDR